MALSNRIFYGFSSAGSNIKSQEYSDLELVKRDLLNLFNTRVGERVMMPTYGCDIWDWLFEPFDQLAIEAITNTCQQIVYSDSRLQLLNTTVTSYEYGIQIGLEILYVPLNAVTTFSMDFDQRSATS